MTIDPLAEVSRAYSPNAYGNDNSVRFTDPEGRMTQDELMEMYRRQEINQFANQMSGELGFASSYKVSTDAKGTVLQLILPMLNLG